MYKMKILHVSCTESDDKRLQLINFSDDHTHTLTHTLMHTHIDACTHSHTLTHTTNQQCLVTLDFIRLVARWVGT